MLRLSAKIPFRAAPRVGPRFVNAPRIAVASSSKRTLTTSPLTFASHFDTHGFVTRLEASGMPREQADTLVTALSDVVEESIKGLEKGLVSREEGERWRYSQKVRRESH